jgi:hypothetical protein
MKVDSNLEDVLKNVFAGFDRAAHFNVDVAVEHGQEIWIVRDNVGVVGDTLLATERIL